MQRNSEAEAVLDSLLKKYELGGKRPRRCGKHEIKTLILRQSGFFLAGTRGGLILCSHCESKVRVSNNGYSYIHQGPLGLCKGANRNVFMAMIDGLVKKGWLVKIKIKPKKPKAKYGWEGWAPEKPKKQKHLDRRIYATDVSVVSGGLPSLGKSR